MPKIKTECGWCGEGMWVYPYRLKKAKVAVYCCRDCSWKGTRETISLAHGGDGIQRGKPEKDRIYYRKNAEQIRQRSKAYYQENRDKILARLKKRDRELKAEMIEAYGGRCECCGEPHLELLTIDHIKGGGRAHRRQVGIGRKFYQHLKNQGWPQEDYRLLCFNCNTALGFYGYCPLCPEMKQHKVNRVSANPGRPRTVD